MEKQNIEVKVVQPIVIESSPVSYFESNTKTIAATISAIPKVVGIGSSTASTSEIVSTSETRSTSETVTSTELPSTSEKAIKKKKQNFLNTKAGRRKLYALYRYSKLASDRHLSRDERKYFINDIQDELNKVSHEYVKFKQVKKLVNRLKYETKLKIYEKHTEKITKIETHQRSPMFSEDSDEDKNENVYKKNNTKTERIVRCESSSDSTDFFSVDYSDEDKKENICKKNTETEYLELHEPLSNMLSEDSDEDKKENVCKENTKKENTKPPVLIDACKTLSDTFCQDTEDTSADQDSDKDKKGNVILHW